MIQSDIKTKLANRLNIMQKVSWNVEESIIVIMNMTLYVSYLWLDVNSCFCRDLFLKAHVEDEDKLNILLISMHGRKYLKMSWILSVLLKAYMLISW